MKIKRTYNVQEVKDIITNPIIWKAISTNEDMASFSVVDKRSHIHLIGYVDETPIGVCILHPNLRKEYFCHFQVLPKYRKKYSKEFGILVSNWVWDNTHINTITAAISDKFPKVIKFAENFGFIPVGYRNNKNSKGEYLDGQLLMQLTRDESK